MDYASRIKELCSKKGIKISTLEKELGYGNGSLSKATTKSFSAVRLMEIARYFNVSMEYLMGSEEIVYNSDDREWEYYSNIAEKENSVQNNGQQNSYYKNEETAKMAQKIFENKELQLLFDAAQDADPQDLQAVHAMLLALKRKENH